MIWSLCLLLLGQDGTIVLPACPQCPDCVCIPSCPSCICPACPSVRCYCTRQLDGLDYGEHPRWPDAYWAQGWVRVSMTGPAVRGMRPVDCSDLDADGDVDLYDFRLVQIGTVRSCNHG